MRSVVGFLVFQRGFRGSTSDLRRRGSRTGAIALSSPIQKHSQGGKQQAPKRQRKETQDGKCSCGAPEVFSEGDPFVPGPVQTIPALHKQAHDILDVTQLLNRERLESGDRIPQLHKPVIITEISVLERVNK